MNRLWILLAVLLLLASIPASRAGAAFPGRNGKIAFSSDRDGDVEIYRMKPNGHHTDIYTIRFDGTHRRHLTHNSPYVDLAPDFSPGGHRIAFARQRPGRHYGIWVMRSDGSHERMLTRPRGPFSSGPSFSPNGKKIAYEKSTPGLD